MAIEIGRASQKLTRAKSYQEIEQKERLVHISGDDYEYIAEYLFEHCSGYFNEIFEVGRDYEYNLNLEGRIEYETVYSGSSPVASEEASIVLEFCECRKSAYQNGKEAEYMAGELVKTDFDPRRIENEARIVYG